MDSYGAVEQTKSTPTWTEKGSVINILMGVGAGVASHVVFVFAIFRYLTSQGSGVFTCSGRAFAQIGHFSFFSCQYLSAYMECFPEFTVAMVLMLMGRNILQTRLYYTMLSEGAVVLFRSRNCFKDWLVRAYVWCYLHLVAHLLLIAYVICKFGSVALVGEDAEDLVEHTLGEKLTYTTAISRTDIDLLVKMGGLVLVPSTLFVIFLHGSYDIEKSFVPLSEYFHDAREIVRASSEGWHHEATCTLVALTDGITKVIVENNHKELLASDDGVEGAESRVVKIYRKDGRGLEAHEQSDIGLLDSLWPSRLLASRNTSRLAERGFTATWIAYAFASCACIAFLCLSMAWFGVFNVIAGARGVPEIVHMVIVLIQVAVVARVCFAFGASIMLYLGSL